MATKEEEVMATGDALNELAKMKNVFRAVERVEAVMTAVSRAEGRRTELEAEIKTLDDQKAKWKAYADGQEAAQAEKQKQYDEYTKGLDAKREEAKKKFDADMAEIGKQYSEMTVSAKNKMNEELKAKQAELDALDAKLSDKKRDLRVTLAEFEAAEQKKAVL